ncbi:MucB/RseB C-terminal domain-containing protein [Colwellia sp. RSH04]|uniref:MucB/RseB C-terminal domain-containing protein n=1 Tax=Colwellia sp. RSH04 TaxID=2305464 RepID=UPI000E56EECB|nr:MucB/RseB C-terminal domain-containing protein [Colwellia sp. RSH04]RHW75178.1 transcriptional regulator [Colwellia sp. RSH04]
MKLFSWFLLFFSISFSAVGVETDAIENDSAKVWLERLSKSLRQLNFNTSFVVVKNNQAEPYRWVHGVDDSNFELEILARLNGPRRDILRKGKVVSYIEPEQDVYSVASNALNGPIPAIFSEDITVLEENYRFISVGRSRILGRAAQLIRIVAKDNHRYGYWLWLDQQSALLLKMAVITRQGQLLEQIQFTHLDISEELSDALIQLQGTDLPTPLDLSHNEQEKHFLWRVNWLPEGFKSIKANRHRMLSNRKPVEFMLFSDGLVDVSVYVNPTQEKRRETEFAHDGATLVLNQVINGLEVSVVGKIPLSSAKKIADSIGPASVKPNVVQ